MKLKAPEGAGDPCVAGVTLTARNGVYEAEPEIAALLIECFGFAAAEEDVAAGKIKSAPTARRTKASTRKNLS